MIKLNDKIWGSDNLIIPIVREKLLTIAKKIADDIATLVRIKHIYFTGSLATYRWTPISDIDLHIIVEVLEEHSDDTLDEYFDLMCKLFNHQHNIFIKGYKVEVNIKKEEVLFRDKSAYDLVENKWVKKPSKNTRDLDDPEVIKLATKYQKLIDNLIGTNGSVEEAKKLKAEIKNLRKSGLEEGEGEYSIGNLVFKKLRNTEYLSKLFDYWHRLEDKELSLEKINFKKYINISL
jgi:predicted nucleotidyltransferase